MNRLIAVIIGAAVLLLVGYLMGARPVGGLKEELRVAQEQHAAEVERIKAKANDALGEGLLWQARAQLLVAAQDVRESNYGTASSRVAKAVEHLQSARALPNLTINVGEVESMAAAALASVKSLNPDAEALLLNVASELGSLLERRDA